MKNVQSTFSWKNKDTIPLDERQTEAQLFKHHGTSAHMPRLPAALVFTRVISTRTHRAQCTVQGSNSVARFQFHLTTLRAICSSVKSHYNRRSTRKRTNEGLLEMCGILKKPAKRLARVCGFPDEELDWPTFYHTLTFA